MWVRGLAFVLLASGSALAANEDRGTMTDVTEEPGKRYLFVGARYRGMIVPQAMINLFADGGRTVYNNAFGIELDIRKDNFSIIPSIILAEHGMERTLFHDKGKTVEEASNWSVIGSDIKGLYAAVDLLWSVGLARQVRFEFGFGVGIGVLMGDLSNNWVYGGRGTNNGPLTAKFDGADYSFTPCTRTTDGPQQPGDARAGCQPTDHSNSSVNKVGATADPSTGKVSGGYTEPGWTHGGSVPSIFPYLALPILGLRIKPIKAFEARVQLGFVLPGFFFQISGNYGFERPAK
jgi:hypothetical protein